MEKWNLRTPIILVNNIFLKYLISRRSFKLTIIFIFSEHFRKTFASLR